MTILLLFSFLAGFITILAPCIWPLLPIVLSASAGQGRRRPLGITLGVMTSFTIFTLSISYLEKIFHFDANVFRLIAVIVIGLLGVAMIIPALGTAFENFINRILSPFQNKLQKKGSGFGAGYTTGFSIGLVWAPCAGPILATIATLAATQAVDTRVVLVTLAYVFGLGIPLFILSLAGSKLFGRVRQFTKYTGIIQQVFGGIMIIAAVLIYTNYDKVIQIKILEAFPSYGQFLNKFEHNDVVTEQLDELRGKQYKKQAVAPEFAGIVQWLNSDPLTVQGLRGKVVLIDFWTYSCINCVRTLPHVTGWYEKYKNNNFVIVGVHTPEFAFEKDVNNVRQALRQFNIKYPVALDNDYGTWKAFQNRYWPAKYLIDANGTIRRTHFGEGQYDEMEEAIRALLKEEGQVLTADTGTNTDATPKYERTPETYLGSKRANGLVAYDGVWETGEESVTAQKNAGLEIYFKAAKVFLVISPKQKGDQIKVFLDDKAVDSTNAGQDVADGVVTLSEERLYHLIDLKGQVEDHVLRLEFQQEGIKAYAFTFG